MTYTERLAQHRCGKLLERIRKLLVARAARLVHLCVAHTVHAWERQGDAKATTRELSRRRVSQPDLARPGLVLRIVSTDLEQSEVVDGHHVGNRSRLQAAPNATTKSTKPNGYSVVRSGARSTRKRLMKARLGHLPASQECKHPTVTCALDRDVHRVTGRTATANCRCGRGCAGGCCSS